MKLLLDKCSFAHLSLSDCDESSSYRKEMGQDGAEDNNKCMWRYMWDILVFSKVEKGRKTILLVLFFCRTDME